MTPSLQENIEKHAEKPRVPSKPQKRKRKTLTKRNPQEPQRRALRHARSISMPTPLNAVFGDRPGAVMPDSPVSSSAFAWKPPTRDGATPKAAGRVALDDWVTWREHAIRLYLKNRGALATRPASPTSTVRSMRSDVHNFSRPRTSAAARMQSKVARRLRALKQQETENARRSQVEGPLPASPSSPISPATPRTVRAAAVRTLQDRLGKRNLKKQAEESPRPATPETPRTARATAVKNLQERLGKRMMRRNGEELAQAV
ncbi:hypothetical protein CTAM01_11696 [Colletotrichum tamarilloi]|uniref:Ribosome biogenesis protein SLX9 n=1 Tax=Colletotrichum tamarilloi TaxID=1209934 RepID=A0ABQ9QWZ9_9PEZI|nr:uncharacterized protein CTAM01_11696 [Colletotrichum tamarilloi]KAK1487663.1 hypothetical protein CTAM01_11696 [Colletotrichum tamarilloi]